MCDIESIQQWRKKHGVTQAELARRLGCDRGTVCRLLNGHHKLSDARAARLKEIMTEQDELITVDPPDEVKRQLRAWAEEAHATIEQVVEQLIKELPIYRK